VSDGPTPSPEQLSHVDAEGRARMVDVSDKPVTLRWARATGSIQMHPETLAAIRGNTVAKGDVLGVARLAGIMAAKRTSELVPLCHPIPLTDVAVDIAFDDELPGLRVAATAKTAAQTGVEMEALVAVSVTLVTVYDMAKAVDKSMVIGEISLAEKVGGRSGHWVRT
jgi:cyclic pyranopterin phosphate synthase